MRLTVPGCFPSPRFVNMARNGKAGVDKRPFDRSYLFEWNPRIIRLYLDKLAKKDPKVFHMLKAFACKRLSGDGFCRRRWFLFRTRRGGRTKR